MGPILNVPSIFGSDVFNESTMKQRLSPRVFNAWKTCIETGSSLSLDIANDIADGFENYKDVLDCILEELRTLN